MPKDQLHIGRLSNNAEGRLYRKLADTVDKAQHTCTTQLLVIGDGNVDRHLEIATGQLRHKGEDNAYKALHIASTATV